MAGGAALDPDSDPVLGELVLAAALSNYAQLRQQGDSRSVEGDPMEGALLALSAKAGHDIPAARAEFPRRDAIPFDARHRYMASLHARPDVCRWHLSRARRGACRPCAPEIATPEGTGALDRDAWARRGDILRAACPRRAPDRRWRRSTGAPRQATPAVPLRPVRGQLVDDDLHALEPQQEEREEECDEKAITIGPITLLTRPRRKRAGCHSTPAPSGRILPVRTTRPGQASRLRFRPRPAPPLLYQLALRSSPYSFQTSSFMRSAV